MAAPVMAASEMGVSTTRFSPKCSIKPSVTLKAPPYTPMSSPSRKTLGSRSISSQRPARMASRYVVDMSSGFLVHAVQQARWVGVRTLLGPFHRLVDFPQDTRAHAVEIGFLGPAVGQHLRSE